MKRNQRRTETRSIIPIGIAAGLTGSILMTLIGAGIVAGLIHTEIIQENTIKYGAMITVLISASLGAWIAWHKIKRQRLIICLSVGGAYYLCLLSITALVFGGQYEGIGIMGATILLGCIAVGLIGLKASNKRKFKFPKIQTG